MGSGNGLVPSGTITLFQLFHLNSLCIFVVQVLNCVIWTLKFSFLTSWNIIAKSTENYCSCSLHLGFLRFDDTKPALIYPSMLCPYQREKLFSILLSQHMNASKETLKNLDSNSYQNRQPGLAQGPHARTSFITANYFSSCKYLISL